MSLTVQEIVLEAKNLANKLKEQNSIADFLLSQGQCVHKQLDAMKQYSDEVGELNTTARQRPHSVLVAGIQQENRHLRELQQENRELRAALEEHQTAMEVIMTRYRQQITKFIQSSNLDVPKLFNRQYSETIYHQNVKIKEMATVMKKAAEADEEVQIEYSEAIERLSTENKGLRDLLNISVAFGSNNSNQCLSEEETGNN